MQVRKYLKNLTLGQHGYKPCLPLCFYPMFSNNWYEFLSFPLDDPHVVKYMIWNIEVLRENRRLTQVEIRDFAQHLRIYGECCKMAKKDKKDEQPAANGNDGFVWVVVELSDADGDLLDGIDWSAEEILDNQAELIRDGYSISTKFDGRTGSTACHITCNKPLHPDFRHGITGYGDTLRDSVVVALFKFGHKCKGSLSGYTAERRKYR